MGYILTDSSDNERNEEPWSTPDHLENVYESGQSEERDEDDRRNSRRIIVVEGICGVVGHGFGCLNWVKEKSLLKSKDNIETEGYVDWINKVYVEIYRRFYIYLTIARLRIFCKI